MIKRLIYALAILLAIALIIAGGYFLRTWLAEPEAPQTGPSGVSGLPLPPGTPPAPGQLPGTPATPAVPQKLSLVADVEAVAFAIDQSGAAILVQPDGQIVRVSKNQSEVFNSSPVPNLKSVGFSWDAKMVLVAFGVDTKTQYSVFDVAKKAWSPLAIEASAYAWSPNDGRLVYYSSQGSSPGIYIINLAAAKPVPQKTLSFSAQDITLAWTTADKIIFGEQPTSYSRGSLFVFDQKTKALSPLAEDTLGLVSTWNQAVNTGLVFRSGGQSGGDLLLTNGRGGVTKELGVLTLPSKCVFGSEPQPTPSSTSTPKTATTNREFLLCAVPQNRQVFSSSRLPDAYLKREVFSSDDVYKIDVQSGEVGAILVGDHQEIDVDAPRLVQNKLFFLNRLDKKVYALSLGAD
ncbi:MAG: hypothetical protein AAB686_01060 [Patescibacteria group bacterium]